MCVCVCVCVCMKITEIVNLVLQCVFEVRYVWCYCYEGRCVCVCVCSCVQKLSYQQI